MKESQEPKFRIVNAAGNPYENGRIANRHTGKVIPDDEPIMVFRAKDIRAVQAIHLYAELCKNPGHQRIVMKRLEDFKRFQDAHPERCKEPD